MQCGVRQTAPNSKQPYFWSVCFLDSVYFPYFYYICLAYTESRYETNTQPILVGYMDRPAPSAISITNIHAQPLCRIQHYSINDGLSQSFVQRMVQSDDGLLWFGTWDGLNCYDGYSFTTYNMVSPGGTALSTNRLTDIQIGADGDLWCSTYDAWKTPMCCPRE